MSRPAHRAIPGSGEPDREPDYGGRGSRSHSVLAFGLTLAALVSGSSGVAFGQAPGCGVTSIGVDTSLAAPDTASTMGLRCGEAGGRDVPGRRHARYVDHRVAASCGDTLRRQPKTVDHGHVP